MDCCLIPEVDIDLYDDEYGVLPYVRRCVERKGHCVIVISMSWLWKAGVRRDRKGAASFTE